jgi:nucleotide-binding universal stress UspA family protein
VILAATGRETSKVPAQLAKQIADRLGLGLQVISVIEPISLYTDMAEMVPVWFDGETNETREQSLRRYLRTAVASDKGWDIDVRYGEPIREVSRAARELDATLVVVAASPRVRGHHVVAGHRAAQLLRTATCPVLSVAPGQSELPKRIVAAVDFGEASLRALQTALLIAGEGATATLVHIAPQIDYEALLDETSQAEARQNVVRALERLRDEIRPYVPDLQLTTKVVTGPVINELLTIAQELNADLVVAGTHGPNVIERFFVGSVAGDLLRFTSSSVLAAPARMARPVPLEQRVPGSTATDRPEDWGSLLDGFAKRNAGRNVAIEVDDPSFGAQMQSQGYRLNGVVYDPVARRIEVMLGAEPGSVVHLTRGIEGVKAIAFNRDRGGRDQALEIRHGDGHTLVRFPD